MKLNRIKIVLTEKDKKQTELSTFIGKNSISINKWCSNDIQPSLSDLKRVADFLDVPLRELIVDYKPE